MRKFIAILIVGVMVMSILAGCGRRSESKVANTGTKADQKGNKSSLTESSVKESVSGEMNQAYDMATSNASYEPQFHGGYLAEGESTGEFKLEEFNTEEYKSIKENGYVSVAYQSLSTFSADVDTASYSNVRRMIQNGYFDGGAVRTEEMINYFTYQYATPSSEEPFAVTTEYSKCPWNPDTKLMLVGIQTEKIDFSNTPPANLVFLIDVSGSMMDDDKLPLVQKAFNLLTENLTEKDRVSIVTYASGDTVVLEGANGIQRETVMEAINNLYASGSTAGSKGIKTAYEIAQKYFIPNGNNRVILATDGDLNVGLTSESELENLITEKKETGIYLSVLGFGTGNIKDNKMEVLADKGNGNYAYIDSIMEAKKVLVDEMGATLVTVASDVKFQIEFNPNLVKGYRLLGYENRMLATEDFEDDTKDAGEVGAGHSVTVLYEIVPVDSKMELSTTELKYQNTTEPTMNKEELLTVSIRYKKPGESTSQLMQTVVNQASYANQMPDNLCFAACVAQFSMMLRDSEYKGTASYESLIDQLTSDVIGNDSYREEFRSLVELAKKYKFIE